MDTVLAKAIVDAIAQDLSQFKFCERYDDVTDNIVGIVKKARKPLNRLFGGHGIVAVAVVPESVTSRAALKEFFQETRNGINSRFVGSAAYKSAHSFVVLLCPHTLFLACSGIASELKDRSGLHTNIIQGVVLVDADTRDVTGDYTRPAQNKREYNAVLSAVSRAVT